MEPELRTLVERFASNFLWVDDGWIDWFDDGFTYCQARLPQHFMVEGFDDGRVKVQVGMPVVKAVVDDALALAVCASLNRTTAGWSFAYDEDSREVHALMAMNTPRDWDRHWLRLAQTAKLAGWYCDSIAEALAHLLGGEPAFGHPRDQPGPREVPDATYYYVQERRARPEWLLDPTVSLYPVATEVAGFFSQASGAPVIHADNPSASWELDASMLSSGEVPARLRARFTRHPYYGDVFASSMVFPLFEEMDPAAQCNWLSWEMFNRPETNLLGGWSFDDDELRCLQLSPTSDLRSMEDLPSFAGHGAAELWSLASTLADTVLPVHNMLYASPPVVSGGGESRFVADEAAGRVMDVFFAPGREALRAVPTPQADVADRRLLWVEVEPLLIYGFFNPMGPTVGLVGLAPSPDSEDQVLVHLMRHPFAPESACVRTVAPGSDLSAVLDEELPEILPNLPTFVDLSMCSA